MHNLKLPISEPDPEVAFCAEGIFSANSPEALTTRYLHGNYRRSEALARSSRDEIQLLIALLCRGSVKEARIIIDRMKKERPDGQIPVDEVLIQEARFAYLSGNWGATVEICNHLEEHYMLSALNLMAIYQIRSNANYELSEFELSLADALKIEGLESLLPHGQLPLYAKANRLRLMQRMGDVEESKRQEKTFWQKWRNENPVNPLDVGLTLLRCRIELLRTQGITYLRESLATYAISKALGDHLYAGLSFFDLYCNLLPHNEMVKRYKDTLDAFAREHPRLQKLMDESLETSSKLMIKPSETAKCIRQFISLSSQVSHIPPVDPNQINCIIFLDSGIALHLDTQKLNRFEPRSQAGALIDVLSDGPVEKELIFKKIWKLKSFSMEKHDQVIRVAIHRMRTQTGIVIESKNREVRLSETVLVVRA